METFISKRHLVSCQQLVLTTPDKIFPLLCPKREFDWIPTWDCEIIFSESGHAELGCIFVTNFPGDPKITWFVDKYETDKLIQFILFSESSVIRYSITLSGNDDGTTILVWEQTITSLNEEGNKFIETFSDENFSARIKGLEKLLNHYLTTGEMLR